MNLKTIFITLLSSILLLACSGKGSEFVGTWHSSAPDPYKMTPSDFQIERDGEAFRVTDDGGKHYANLSPQPDGTLKLAGTAAVFSYSKAEDTLTAFNKQYKRN